MVDCLESLERIFRQGVECWIQGWGRVVRGSKLLFVDFSSEVDS
jgi:hypothetical protein